MEEILLRQSIFKVGEVFSVNGREIKIKVDKLKNSSHLFYKGVLLKNVSVGGYVKIRKGFSSIIAKVENEFVIESQSSSERYRRDADGLDRYLIVKLLGCIEDGRFKGGIRELPLVGNKCYLLTPDEFSCIHSFVGSQDFPLKIGTLYLDAAQEISIGVNSIFASHIGIFGNTGSGKSYTLAKLYNMLMRKFKDNVGFKNKMRFFLIDFNDEYSGERSITENKKVYNLSTKQIVEGDHRDKFPLKESDLLDIELVSILADATEKTQKPFISRSLNFYRSIHTRPSPEDSFKAYLRNRIKDMLRMSDKDRSRLLLDYIRAILPIKEDPITGLEDNLEGDIEWNGTFLYWMPRDCRPTRALTDTEIEQTDIFLQVSNYHFPEDSISKLVDFLYAQIIFDVFYNKAHNEHIAPVINKLKSKVDSIVKVFDTRSVATDIWERHNFVIVNLHDVNLDMKKTIPLLLAKKIYSEHKKENNQKSLNIIVDEAHNILSYISSREADSWKDYRLETFEEIIKEGRKFGVFLTIASQRPSDISSTIISQLHNYFLHRLINENDIEAIGRVVSYLDKVSVDALHVLPTGTCVLAGLFAENPVVVDIDVIEDGHEPKNKTIDVLEQILIGSIE